MLCRTISIYRTAAPLYSAKGMCAPFIDSSGARCSEPTMDLRLYGLVLPKPRNKKLDNCSGEHSRQLLALTGADSGSTVRGNGRSGNMGTTVAVFSRT